MHFLLHSKVTLEPLPFLRNWCGSIAKVLMQQRKAEKLAALEDQQNQLKSIEDQTVGDVFLFRFWGSETMSNYTLIYLKYPGFYAKNQATVYQLRPFAWPGRTSSSGTAGQGNGTSWQPRKFGCYKQCVCVWIKQCIDKWMFCQFVCCNSKLRS